MEEIASQFFNTLDPCPKEIPDCENLRTEYTKTLDSLKVKSGCSPCAERNLKNTFISRIKLLLGK